jgi:hypothetical protein
VAVSLVSASHDEAVGLGLDGKKWYYSYVLFLAGRGDVVGKKL